MGRRAHVKGGKPQFGHGCGARTPLKLKDTAWFLNVYLPKHPTPFGTGLSQSLSEPEPDPEPVTPIKRSRRRSGRAA